MIENYSITQISYCVLSAMKLGGKNKKFGKINQEIGKKCHFLARGKGPFTGTNQRRKKIAEYVMIGFT